MQIIKGKQKKAQRVVIYGPEGIGKTTIASKFPKPIFIDTEGGTYELNVDRLPNPTSWTMFKEQLKFVDQSEYQTLVIDTADWAERLCVGHILVSKGIESLGGAKDYGKSYNLLYQEWGNFLNYLNEIMTHGKHVVILAHAQQRRTDLPNEMDSYDRWELKLEKKTSAATKEWADMVLFVNYKTIVVETETGKPKAQGGKRVMYTNHHPCWDAKNRVGLPEECSLDYAVLAPHIDISTPKTAKVTSTPIMKEDDEERAAIQADGIKNPQLADLMALNDVKPEEIQKIVGAAGFFPNDMPINDYPDDFINAKLVGEWDQLFDRIKKMKGIV